MTNIGKPPDHGRETLPNRLHSKAIYPPYGLEVWDDPVFEHTCDACGGVFKVTLGIYEGRRLCYICEKPWRELE